MSEKTLIAAIRDFPTYLSEGRRAGGMAAHFISSEYSSINYIFISLTREGARYLLRMRKACDLIWEEGHEKDRHGIGLPLSINFRSEDFGMRVSAYMDINVDDKGQYDTLTLSYNAGEDHGKERVTISTGVLVFDPRDISLEIREKFSGEFAKISLDASLLERVADGWDDV
ncbi:MAG: hypothetical protein LBC94_08415 [Desulfovibrio sp.]|jgi:hypothetical protein|nr:hypothetical protein [Desulfovibrio sp.]